MAIGQDIGMGTSYGGGITGLNTGLNLAATGLQAPTWQETVRESSTRPYVGVNPESPQFAPSRRAHDLNQLYQTAMDAFSRTGRGTWGTDMPGQYKDWAMTTGVPPTSATGIATLPTGTQTNIVPTAEPTYPTQDEFLQQKQAAWRAQNPDPAVMPSFRITGTDLPASEAAGYDVPLWEEMAKPPMPGEKPRMAVVPEQYGDFFNSQFYDPGAAGLAVLTPVTLPSGETITFSDSESARQFQQYLQSLAGGGMVGLDYLTRGL